MIPTEYYVLDLGVENHVSHGTKVREGKRSTETVTQTETVTRTSRREKIRKGSLKTGGWQWRGMRG